MIFDRYYTDDQDDFTALTLSDVDRLRLGWTSRLNSADIRRILQSTGSVGIWNRTTGDYLLAGPWRHRHDVLGVIELSSRRGATRMMRQFVEEASARGARLALFSEHNEMRQPAFYESAGFELLEHIMIYELPRIPSIDMSRFRLDYERVLPGDESAIKELLTLDHCSFPWLWWNSPEEFDNYCRTYGVEIYIGRDQDRRAISYAGVTRFRAWGHLDRIAVSPEMQGQGIGLETLDWAVFVLGRSGAQKIGLSTQARNQRSRTVYERYGFHRSSSQDYYLYGRWLNES